MTGFKLSILGLVFFLAVSISFGQDFPRDPGGVPVNSPPPWVQRAESARQENARRMEESNGQGALMARRPPPKNSPDEETKQVIEEINQKLDAPEYRIRFAQFLKNKNTGITRIYPEKGCGRGKVVTLQELERCAEMPEIPGGGSLYSVRLSALPSYLSLKLILGYVEQSDIHFVDDKFIVGNKMTLDIIASVGDLPLENIDLKSESFKYLASYKPGRTKSEFEAQKNALEKGIHENGYLYSASAPVKLNNTYVLRSIAYYSGYPSFWNTDLLIAFKVVGQEKDGSIIVLWKKLKEKDAPSLAVK